MIYNEKSNLLALKYKELKELEREFAIKSLKERATKYKQELLHEKINNQAEIKHDNDYFSTLKSENYMENEDNIFNIHLNQFWQKQTTISNYNHADTSYIKYEVYIQIDNEHSQDKYLLECFKDKKQAEDYFDLLKKKLTATPTNDLFKELIEKYDKEISYLKKLLI